jgi:hypothetical protein
MKQDIMKLKRWLILFFLPLWLSSCEKNNGTYIQVKAIENQVYEAIRDYREDNGLSGHFVHQYLMVEEAQKYSYKMAYGMVAVGTQGLDEHWAVLNEKYGFYNESGLVLSTGSGQADGILDELLAVPGADSVLLGDVTQCGVGIESDTGGINYITVLLAKADS